MRRIIFTIIILAAILLACVTVIVSQLPIEEPTLLVAMASYVGGGVFTYLCYVLYLLWREL